MQEAGITIAKMPSCADKFDRLAMCSEISAGIDMAFARQCFEQASQLVRQFSGREGASAARRLVDLVYKHDQALAEKIAEELDIDEARRSAREGIEEGRQRQKDDEAFFERKVASPGLLKERGNELGNKLLGEINAGLRVGLSLREAAGLAASAGAIELRGVGWLYEAIIEAVEARHAGTAEAVTFGMEMLQVCTSGIRFVEVLAGMPVVNSRVSDERECLIVGAGEADKARQFIASAFRGYQGDILIGDPYWAPAEIWAVVDLARAGGEVSVRIISSIEQIRKTCDLGDLEEQCIAEWKRLCLDAMPRIEILLVGVGKEGRSPIHDRCIIGSDRGVDTGGSLNGLGGTREVKLTKMGDDERMRVKRQHEEYWERAVRRCQDERVAYVQVSL